MSTALAMILAAGMTIPGTGPEKVSGEMVRGLDLRGQWEGVWWLGDNGPQIAWIRHTIQGNPVILVVVEDGAVTAFHGPIVDEGRGQFRMKNTFGIYRWDGDRLILCFAGSGWRPTSLQAGDQQYLLILHRIKPGK